MMTKNGIQDICSFSGKEKDAETGYGYFGARYMDHELMTMWLSVDPMVDKYPDISPYAYCSWNPIIAKDPNGMDSVRTPNGMANAGTGYKATPDGQYLYGEGLKTKRWNPDLVIGGVVGDGLRGGYEDWDMPSDIAAYVPCATCSETNSEFLMPPILPFMASSYDLLGNENFSGNIAIRGDGTLMYSNKEGFGKGGFGKGLSWRNGRGGLTSIWRMWTLCYRTSSCITRNISHHASPSLYLTRYRNVLVPESPSRLWWRLERPVVPCCHFFGKK